MHESKLRNPFKELDYGDLVCCLFPVLLFIFFLFIKSYSEDPEGVITISVIFILPFVLILMYMYVTNILYTKRVLKENILHELKKYKSVKTNNQYAEYISLVDNAKNLYENKKYKKCYEKLKYAEEKYEIISEEIFAKKQKAKGLVEYDGRWGTPEQVKRWKEIDIGIDTNFADLDPYEFEEFIAELFRKMGYDAYKTKSSGDFGADVVAEKGNEKVVIQVKKYSYGNNVSSGDVQKTLGAMWKYGANKALFVTTSDYTVAAKEAAKEAPIELWDKEMLDHMVRRYFIEEKLPKKPKVDVNRINEVISKEGELRCPVCGGELQPRIICPYCGVDITLKSLEGIESTYKCPVCGKEVRTRFVCKKCKTDLDYDYLLSKMEKTESISEDILEKSEEKSSSNGDLRKKDEKEIEADEEDIVAVASSVDLGDSFQ